MQHRLRDSVWNASLVEDDVLVEIDITQAKSFDLTRQKGVAEESAADEPGDLLLEGNDAGVAVLAVTGLRGHSLARCSVDPQVKHLSALIRPSQECPYLQSLPSTTILASEPLARLRVWSCCRRRTCLRLRSWLAITIHFLQLWRVRIRC